MASTHVWPHATLTKIVGKPTASDILTLQGEIYENAESWTTHASVLGHLGLVMPELDYISEPGSHGVPYVPPEPPGPYIATSGCTHRRWEHAKAAYDTYLMGKVRLLAQILEAVNETWTYDLQTPGRKYTNCTPAQAFAHLKHKYGTVTTEEEDANRSKMREKWDDNQPIGLLWARVAKTCAFATYWNAPITNTDKVSETLKVLINCPKYERAVETWYEKGLEDRTWDNLVSHFDLFKENHQHITSTRNTKYHSANVATSSNPASISGRAGRVSVFPLSQ